MRALGTMGEKKREAQRYIFACQGLPAQGLQKVGERDGGGGYSLSVKQEVAQHLFHGISEGSEQQTAARFRSAPQHTEAHVPGGRRDVSKNLKSLLIPLWDKSLSFAHLRERQ